MASVQNIIDRVKDNLGNRDTGNIGSRTVDVTILDNINKCMLQIAKSKKHIQAFEKSISIPVTTSGYKYLIPSLDVDGNTIRIKKVLKLISIRGSETIGYPLDRIHPLRRDTLFPLTNTTRVGRPILYSSYGAYFEFYPFPDASYTVSGRVIVWPTVLTAGSTSTGLGEEFDDVVEANVTAACFQSLQQLDDAKYWDKQYSDLLFQTLSCLDDYPDEIQFPGYGTSLIGEMYSSGPVMAPGRTSSYNSALGIS